MGINPTFLGSDYIYGIHLKMVLVRISARFKSPKWTVKYLRYFRKINVLTYRHAVLFCSIKERVRL